MAKFLVSETQVVRYSGVYEADTAEEAKTMFLDGEAPLEREQNSVKDSYGLDVQPWCDL